MRVIVVGIIGLLGCSLGGCANPNTKPEHLAFGTSSDTVVMGPNLRLVTERQRQIDNGPPLPTVCTEPSPDVAIAFGRTLAITGSVAETGATTTSGSINAASSEVATALAGRTAGVLALRDGLYAACQSYVNGMLGHDAYAVILSQYGRLLVSLAGTGTSGNPTPYSAQETAISAMLVACISEHDPTRIRPIKIKYPGDTHGKLDLNPLLSERRCKQLIDGIASGKMMGKTDVKKKAEKTAAKTEEAPPKAGEETTTTTTTVKKKAGPPAK